MGFDLYDDNGGYVRASVWAWLPLADCMIRAGLALAEEVWSNDGRRIEPGRCRLIADVFEEGLRVDPREEFALDDGRAPGIYQLPDGQLVTEQTAETRTPYRIRREHVQEFIDFCRAAAKCGGFRIC